MNFEPPSTYENITPHFIDKLKKLWKEGVKIYIYGKGGTHLTAWGIAGIGRTTHAENKEQLKRYKKIIIIKKKELIKEAMKYGTVVETFRKGKQYGIKKIYMGGHKE